MKTSNEIVNYILSDVVTVRYCVPIVCLSVMDFSLTGREDIFVIDIYSALIRRITGNKKYLNNLIEKNQDFFGDYLNTKDHLESRLYDYLKSRVYDIRDIDGMAFDEIMFMKDLLEQLVYGRVSLYDLMHESETLKSYFMSLGLYIGALSVKNNNMYVSAL